MSNYTRSFYDNLYIPVEAEMTTKKTREFLKVVQLYMDKNSDILKSVNFSKRLLFSKDLQSTINNLFGITPKMIKEAAIKSSFIDHEWQVTNKPIYVTLTCLMIYYMKKKDKKMVSLTLYLLAMPMFSSLVYKYWKYGVNQEVMDYTINNMTNKFLIKKTGTILGMLMHTCDTIYKSYHKDLIKGDDKEGFHKFISGLNTRLNKNIKKIANEYNKNYEEGNYLNKDSDDLDDENYRIISNDTFKVVGLSRKVISGIISYGYDPKIVRIAKNLSQDVSLKKLNGILDSISEMEQSEINEFIIRLIEVAYIKGYSIDDVKLSVFLKISTEVYRSNSKDPTIIFIKETLEKWIDLRSSTKHNYKRAVFYVFILTIQKEAKGGDF